MFARSRSQLRLLLFAAVSAATFIVPGVAHAVPDASIDGIFEVAPPFYETQVAQYDVDIVNNNNDTGPGTLTVSVTGEFLGSVTFTPSGKVTSCAAVVVTGETRSSVCTVAFAGTGAADIGSVRVDAATTEDPEPFPSQGTVEAELVITGGDITTESADFEILNGNPDCNGDEFDFLPNRSIYFASQTLDQARAAGVDGSIDVSCMSSFESIGEVNQVTGSQGGTLDISTLEADEGSATVDGTVTYSADPAALATGRSISETFEVNVIGDSGLTTIVELTFDISPQADLVSTITVPATLAVATAGTTTTVTGSLRNAGPNTAFDSSFNFRLTDKATVVSSSAGCTRFAGVEQSVEPGIQIVNCPVASLAAGATSNYSVTLRYQPSVNGLVLPSSDSITATTFGNSSSIGDAEDTNLANNNATSTVQLTAAVVPPPVVVPPATPKPTTGGPINGTAGDDRTSGTGGNDIIRSGGGNDIVSGGAGNDAIAGGTGNDALGGGLGNDSLFGGLGNDALFGGAGADREFGGEGVDRIFGGTGNDLLSGDAGNDGLIGGTGNDGVSGGAGNDYMRGGTGNDTMRCGTGIDRAFGDAGNDVIGCVDGVGNDTLVGGPGTDTCIGDVGDRFLQCERVIRR